MCPAAIEARKKRRRDAARRFWEFCQLAFIAFAITFALAVFLWNAGAVFNHLPK